MSLCSAISRNGTSAAGIDERCDGINLLLTAPRSPASVHFGTLARLKLAELSIDESANAKRSTSTQPVASLGKGKSSESFLRFLRPR